MRETPIVVTWHWQSIALQFQIKSLYALLTLERKETLENASPWHGFNHRINNTYACLTKCVLNLTCVGLCDVCSRNLTWHSPYTHIEYTYRSPPLEIVIGMKTTRLGECYFVLAFMWCVYFKRWENNRLQWCAENLKMNFQ